MCAVFGALQAKIFIRAFSRESEGDGSGRRSIPYNECI